MSFAAFIETVVGPLASWDDVKRNTANLERTQENYRSLVQRRFPDPKAMTEPEREFVVSLLEWRGKFLPWQEKILSHSDLWNGHAGVTIAVKEFRTFLAEFGAIVDIGERFGLEFVPKPSAPGADPFKPEKRKPFQFGWLEAAGAVGIGIVAWKLLSDD